MTVDEMESVLDSLGIEYVNTNGDEIQGFCPAHVERTGKQDRNPSWYINSDTGAHICFSCDFRGNIVSLVAKIRNYADWEDAIEWLHQGGELSERFERAVSKPKAIFDELVYISEASLASFDTPPEYALKARGLTQAAAEKFGLLWNTSKSMWIIPVRELGTNKLLGWQEKAHLNRYFNNYPSGMKKSESLFGYAQYSGDNLIVVESPLDVVRLESIGISGAVSTFGALISEAQFKYILRADTITFAMDNDQAGNTASMKALLHCNKLGVESWFFNYNQTTLKDVGGMSKSEVIYGVDSAIHSIRYGLGARAC